MKKKKSKLGIFIIIILVAIICGYFIYNQNNKEKLPEWAQYLLNQNISEITVNNRKMDTLYFDPEVGCPAPETITKDQLKDILKTMVKSDLTNYKKVMGFGGPCLESIIIKYNGNQKIEFLQYKYIITEDKEIISLLQKEKYTTKTDPTDDTKYDDLFAYEWDASFIDTLFKD